jgi:hypothetical protein
MVFMKLFIVFAPRFYELPLAIARELSKELPFVIFSGLSTGSREIFDGVTSSKDPVISPVDWIDDLERKWISTEAESGKLEEYENILGADTIKRIIIADRQIGSGFVSGVFINETPLIRQMRENDKLRNYIVGLLDYLFNRLKMESPDLVFCYTVAGATAYALSVVCQHMGIPFLRISSARIKSRFVIDNTTDVRLNLSHSIFKQAIENPGIVSNSIDEAREYLNEFRQKPKKYDASEKIHARYIKQRSIVNIIKQVILDIRMIILTAIKRPARDLRKPGAVGISVDRFLTNMNARRIARSGIFNVKPDSQERPFVFFPLHVNPEASTMVQSPMHTNQFAIIETLAKSIPLSMDIIVKEHIPMLGRRPMRFYRELQKIPGVKFASPFEDSFEFIKKAGLVCSITSTVAWEAILLGRPTLIIGNPYFAGLGQGFVHCPELTSLPRAVSEAMTVKPVEEKRLELYIASILASSFDMPVEIYTGGVTCEMVEKNHDAVKSISRNILNFIEKTITAKESVSTYN